VLLHVLVFITLAIAGHTPVGILERAGDPQPKPAIHVIHLPGILGPRRIDRTFTAGLADGLRASGAVVTVETFDWVGRRRGTAALVGDQENRRQAELLADRIRQLQRTRPDRHVLLTAHSGGTGPMLFAIEQLHDPVAGGVLLASALSPGYDLRKGLLQTERGILSFVSPADGLILGVGTRAYGTIDGVKTAGAGMTGFTVPADVDPRDYDKLSEIWWEDAFVPLGHLGGHTGMMREAFAREVVAPAAGRLLGLPELEDAVLPTTRPVIRPTTRPATRPADAVSAVSWQDACRNTLVA
jgi:hypothetical protein